MKKIIMLAMPLMAISFLTNCGSKVTYTLTYTYDNESTDKYVETYDKDQKTKKPTWEPSYVNHSFDGWFTKSGKEGELFTFGDALTNDTVVFAHWSEKPSPESNYVVTFDAGENGKFLSGEQKISFMLKSGTRILPYIKQLCPPTSENQIFAYYEYAEKDCSIDYDDVVTSDITLKANYLPNTSPTDDLSNFDWKTIKNIAVTGSPSKWFNVGATKKVKVNEKDHNVRIIGFKHDKNKNNDEIGITFEFANLISDNKGYSIVTQWNDTDNTSIANNNYLDSSIRMALVKEKPEGGLGHILWAQKGKDFWSMDFENKSVLEMLPEELCELLVAPQKTVQCFEDKKWVDKPIVNKDGEFDKLFLLSSEEIGEKNTREGAYAYYQEKDQDKLSDLRVKKEVNHVVDRSIPTIPNHRGQTYKSGEVKNYAGYEVSGGVSWLRSPSTDKPDDAYCVNCSGALCSYDFHVYNYALAIAPAFCI